MGFGCILGEIDRGFSNLIFYFCSHILNKKLKETSVDESLPEIPFYTGSFSFKHETTTANR